MCVCPNVSMRLILTAVTFPLLFIVSLSICSSFSRPLDKHPLNGKVHHTRRVRQQARKVKGAPPHLVRQSPAAMLTRGTAPSESESGEYAALLPDDAPHHQEESADGEEVWNALCHGLLHALLCLFFLLVAGAYYDMYRAEERRRKQRQHTRQATRETTTEEETETSNDPNTTTTTTNDDDDQLLESYLGSEYSSSSGKPSVRMSQPRSSSLRPRPETTTSTHTTTATSTTHTNANVSTCVSSGEQSQSSVQS